MKTEISFIQNGNTFIFDSKVKKIKEMGAGVSLPLPRNGFPFPGANLFSSVSLVCSDPFTRDYDFVCVRLLPITIPSGHRTFNTDFFDLTKADASQGAQAGHLRLVGSELGRSVRSGLNESEPRFNPLIQSVQIWVLGLKSASVEAVLGAWRGVFCSSVGGIGGKMVAFVLANAVLVGSLQHPQLLALGNLRVDYSHAKPTAAYGSSG